MKISITTDSTCDLPEEVIQQYNIHVLPLLVNLGEKTFRDGEITLDVLFDYVDETKQLPKTAAIPSDEFKESFERILSQDKSDAIIHISIGADLSCSYQNACLAAREMNNVYIIDSASLSTGIGLLVLSAADKVKEGKAAKTIVEEIQAQTENMQVSFVIDKLDFLHKGGRCSALAKLGANLLGIKPKIAVKNGKLGVDRKYMGKLFSVLPKYADDLLEDYPNAIKNRVFITYTTAEKEVVAELRNKLKNAGFKEVLESTAGSVIASHCGKGTLGILFMTK